MLRWESGEGGIGRLGEGGEYLRGRLMDGGWKGEWQVGMEA